MGAVIDPPPSLSAIRSLEERQLRAWPALETMPCQGWHVRYAEGCTRRANSASAICPTARFATVRPLVEIFYRGHRRPVIFRITPLAGDAEDELERAGYEAASQTLVMLANLPTDPEADEAVRIEPAPSPAWLKGHAESTRMPLAQHRLHRRLLTAVPKPCAFATLEEDGAVLGLGLAVADKGMVGLFDILVAPGARRRGVGRRIASALMRWGRAQPALGAYLQVEASNSAAIALYLDLGFQEAYRYHYRIAR
jgi:ribosomal protein S18 acetylase RimI-like enzyme